MSETDATNVVSGVPLDVGRALSETVAGERESLDVAVGVGAAERSEDGVVADRVVELLLGRADEGCGPHRRGFSHSTSSSFSLSGKRTGRSRALKERGGRAGPVSGHATDAAG